MAIAVGDISPVNATAPPKELVELVHTAVEAVPVVVQTYIRLLVVSQITSAGTLPTVSAVPATLPLGSPAYDLNPVPLEEKARALTTWISEEGPDADLDQARRAARYFALKDVQAEKIISEVSAALSGWQNTARQLGMSAADIAVYATAIVSEN